MKFRQNIIKISGLLMLILVGSVNAQQNLAQEAYAIIEDACLICHGENGSFSDDLLIEYTALIEDGSVVPEDPGASVFYQRLIETDIAKRMPLGQPPLDPASIETIHQWIAAGAPDWNDIPSPETDFITTDTVLQTIENHVNSLPSRNKLFARYFTLTHLYNAGETTEALNAYRRALSKLINSLSWGREVVKPQPIDAEQTLFYIDLRDYEWDVRNDAWTQIEEVYPYKMTFDAPTQTHLREKLTTLQQEMSCEVPFVHVDWFLATASLPPLYHDILALPETDRELEASLEVFVAENLRNAPGKRVWRAGFNNSRVSRHNRVLERHISRYGAYWKSYDFAGSSESQSVFTHPLDFSQDGGEIIFNLPNGLQAYFIVDREGIRIDAAPISIVSNPAVADPTVRTGLSCIGCHTKGMQTFEDEVRAVVEQADNPPFNKERALELYVEKTEMDELVAEDMQRFRVALEETGGVFGGIEPVQRLHEAFQGPLSAAHAAAAVGLETRTFLEKISNNVSLQNLLGALVVEGGTVKRDAWTSAFHDVVAALDSPDSVLPPVVERPERIPGAGVHIPDATLRAAIEEALGKAPGSEITLNDMARLHYLGVPSNAGVRVLTGLETAISLESFSVWGNPISDITPLAGLQKLHTLDISNTRVSDLKPLVNLTKLKTLLLNGNGISDVSPLVGLISLTHLNLKENVISDISPLAELTQLKWLGLQRNFISDFSPLEALLEKTIIISHDNPGFSGGPKIEGPWLWVTVPGELNDEGRAHLSTRDLLAAASNNQVTEQEIATNGVTEGEKVGDSTWTVGELNAGDEDNINTMLRAGGLNPSQYPDYVVYGSTILYSPLEQNTKMFVGSDTSTKVWLNGTLIRKNNGHYHAEGYQTFFPITLKAGKNVLLVAIDNSSGDDWSGYFGFEEGTEYTVSPSLNVHIPDANLRAVIEETLGKAASDVITGEDMATLTELNAEGMGIRNITGLELATNLEELIIRGNPLSDLSPLTKLVTLKLLEFSGESLSDLSPLADLINLERLGFWNTSVSDLSPLTGLTKLRWLGFFSNPMISDLLPLAGLTNLKELHTYSSNKPNLLPLKSLTGLVALSVRGSGVSDISPLAELINLEQLNLEGNRNISDISALASLKKLVYLNLHTNQIEDVSPLAGLHNLERLQLERNNISDFSPLDGLREHTEIFWFSNPGFAQGGPKIEGPWLWMLVSGYDLSNFFDGVDLLSQASNGAVTELEIATTGATIGSPVGENVWTPNRIAPDEYQNIAEMLRTTRIWEKRTRDNVIYGSIILHSPHEQKTKMFTGATGEYKVWFNGEFLHEYGHSGVWGTDYQEFVPVTLKQGINVLLFGIYSRNDKNDWNVKSGYFGFAPDAEYKVLPPRIIADSNLRAVIAEAFDKEDTVPITLEELATLTTLKASNRDIRDLTGIEAAVNLEELWISGNPVSNISPLAALKNLFGLAAWNMAIEDFSPLAELTNLKWLELFNTPISDISPLTRLTSLESLRLYGTGTENLAPLAGLTNLTLLQIANNETLSNISPLAGLINLEWLDLHGCDSLSDISSLARLTKLEYLNLNQSRRVYDYSLSPLSGLTGLRRLRLAENRISDVSSLAGLIGLERLDLPQNQIVDISPLSGLTGLTELYLHANSISDVSSLAGLINLEWLDLRVNQIADISALDGLAARTHISWLKNPGAPIGGPKIEGPWLWLPIPEKQLNSNTDLLSEVSGGSVTEYQIATRGATTGKAVGNYEWAAHKISPVGTYDGYINNMPDMMRAFGLSEEYEWSTETIVVYGSIVINSPREQKTRMFVGSEGRNKVWLNGELVYEQLIRPAEFDYWWDDSDGFNRYFPVTLKPGTNVLLVAVGNGNTITGHFGFEEGTEYTLLPPSEIDVPDPGLRAAIADALDKEDNVPITLEEMATLTILRASNRDIKDLTGIKSAVNLEELWISENPISDLSPLAGLKNLIGLGVWDTPNISDLSPLTKLPKLKWLDFGRFPAPDLSILVDIKSLRRLTFHAGGIEDLSPLAGLTQLTILDIAYNSTTPDLSPITKLTNLEIFVANTCGISDITPLAALTKLKHLDLHNNLISDVSPLAKLVNLEMVKLYGNLISDISPLESSPIFPYVFWLENPGSARSGPQIEGPWTWLKLPAEHFDADWLAEASGGTVTEQQVATYGAKDGQHVGDNVWKSAKIDQEQEGSNIFEILSFGEDDGGKHPLIYSAIVLNSPREQKTKILEGSEDASVKIWLNGDLVHKAVSTRSGARLYDRFSSVTLKEGANVLLVAILNLDGRFRLCSVGFDEGTEYTLIPPGAGFTFSATETTTPSAGDTFSLNLNAENITDLAGWQADIAFDPNALEAIEVTEGDFLKLEGGDTFSQAGTIDNTAGKITGLFSVRISESGVSGTGTLLSVTFKAKIGGETQVTLENFEFVSTTDEIIPTVPPNITIIVGDYPPWDVNQDGRVSIQDLVLVASDLGAGASANLRTDVNRDGFVNIQDLILVQQHMDESTDSAASPVLAMDNEELMSIMVQAWIDQAQTVDDGSLAFRQGIENLQKLLASLLPEKTALLANYPNPFNPETWIPYHLAKPAEVTLTIYAANGAVVRTLALGHQTAGIYQSRSRAAYWDGRNDVGESVASGIYFYTLTAGDFTATRKMLILK